MIIGISGVAGSGKSTTANFLACNHNFVSIALADPMKRFCAEVFGFTPEQLWGPSSLRNAGDPRYVRMRAGELGTMSDLDANGSVVVEPCPKEDVLLSPRHALQQLGTEWGRACYRNVWIDHGIRVATRILEYNLSYAPDHGIIDVGRPLPGTVAKKVGVAFSDLRFLNELEAVKAAGGKNIRLKRGETADYSSHASELEQQDIPDAYFDYIIDNREFTLGDLEAEIARMVGVLLRSDQ